jgi:hypothetical protein
MDSIIPPAVLSVTSLINNVLTSAKSVRDIAKQSSDTALKEQISNLYDTILDVKDRVLELHEENRSLLEQLAKRGSVRRDPEFGYYFKEGSTDPLCPKCYEKEAKEIHLPLPEELSSRMGRTCRVCNFLFWESPKTASRPVARQRQSPWAR